MLRSEHSAIWDAYKMTEHSRCKQQACLPDLGLTDILLGQSVLPDDSEATIAVGLIIFLCILELQDK